MTIAILTDFGIEDTYTGIMKGVMLKINPNVRFIDITNSIPQGSIKKASFRLFTAYKHFPAHTIFLVVVDPGVGTNRHPIIVKTKDYYFVGPDNGIFSWIYNYEKCKVYKIKLLSQNISNTFHGRDVFGPATAKLSKGIAVNTLGTEIKKYVFFKIPIPETSKHITKGKVIDIDGFGNLITNINSDKLSDNITIKIKNFTITGLKKSYEGTFPIAIKGSVGFLEISLPNDNCAKKFNIGTGTEVHIQNK